MGLKTILKILILVKGKNKQTKKKPLLMLHRHQITVNNHEVFLYHWHYESKETYLVCAPLHCMLQVAPQFGVVHGSLMLLPGSFFLLLPLGQHPSDLCAAKPYRQILLHELYTEATLLHRTTYSMYNNIICCMSCCEVETARYKIPREGAQATSFLKLIAQKNHWYLLINAAFHWLLRLKNLMGS